MRTGRTEWPAVAHFYEQLVPISPAVGTRTGYAAAVAETNGPEAELELLDDIEAEAVSAYQPYWAVCAHLLQKLEKLLKLPKLTTGQSAWRKTLQ